MIVRLAQFTPKAGREESVLQTVRAHLAFTAGFPGCRRAYLGTPIHGQQLLVYSEWSGIGDVDRFDAAVRTDPRASSDFFSLLSSLAAPPHVSRFEVVD